MTPTLLVGLHLLGERVVLVGAPAALADRRARLEVAGAVVIEVAPADFAEEHCSGARLVMVQEDDPALVARAEAAARRVGALFYAHDQPARSDLSMPALVRRGPVQVGITTEGRAPALAGRLRTELERLLDARVAELAERVAEARERIGPEAARVVAESLHIAATLRIARVGAAAATLVTLHVVVDAPLEAGGAARSPAEAIAERLEHAVADALGGAHPGVQIVAFSALDPAASNCGRCEACGTWVTDRDQPEALHGPTNGARVDGRLLCDEHLPRGHRWAF